ncbi:hypothetical protein KFF05_02060 [bacterium SCSIO 12827]|nr:hypothetical protein KFF05_02060 [bacterium SCSIO 12827]
MTGPRGPAAAYTLGAGIALTGVIVFVGGVWLLGYLGVLTHDTDWIAYPIHFAGVVAVDWVLRRTGLTWRHAAPVAAVVLVLLAGAFVLDY